MHRGRSLRSIGHVPDRHRANLGVLDGFPKRFNWI
jgi:hypothetical protein